MNVSQGKMEGVSAIVPVRNEEAVIAACVDSLVSQKEIGEILVVNDQSTDQSAAIVAGLARQHRKVRLLASGELPPGWVGKNNAVWRGATEARGEWLLFTDADAVQSDESAAKALAIAERQHADMISFSPEQVMDTWYEKALIPYVYCRLGSRFSFDEVNDASKPLVAAANGQFLMIRRDVYDAVGGHASVAGEVLEDVALSRIAKRAGYRIWFGSGKGIVRVRMYRSFDGMWEGWRKNLYRLMGGTEAEMHRETARALLPLIATVVAAIVVWGSMSQPIAALAPLLLGLAVLLVAYDGELKKNGFPRRLAAYGLAGSVLFAGVLWASYRSYKRGKLEWKGRVYPAGTPGASKK